jgi:hypothetical protein
MKRYGLLPPEFDLDHPPKVNPYTLDRLYWEACSRDAKTEAGSRLLTVDRETYEVVKRDRSGDRVWLYTLVRPMEAWPLKDGAVFIAYLPSPHTGNKGGVRLVSDAKQTLFDCPFDDEIISCQSLTTNNTRVACAFRGVKGPRIVIFDVTPDKQVVWKEAESMSIQEPTLAKIIPEETGIYNVSVQR